MSLRSKAIGALGAATAILALTTPALAQDVAVRGDIVYTMAGETITDGMVVVEDGIITAVGPASQTPLPPGIRVMTARVVTPGLIDAHSTVGLAGYLNQPGDQDQLESSSPIQPELRAIDAYNPKERLVEWVRGLGVTTLHTGHGPGALVSGQTMVVKTNGETVAQAVERPLAMIAANLGTGALESDSKAPGTRSKQMAMLRAALIAAAAPEKPDGEEGSATRNLQHEALREVLNGNVPLMVTAWRAQDILSALRLKEEFGIDMVIDGAADAAMVLDELREAGVPVILHPPRARQYGELENASFATATTLAEAGIPFAFQSGYEGYVPKTRVVLWEAGVAAANGLGTQRALASITSEAARIIGMEDEIGTLEVGKHGDIAMFDSDPFEITGHVMGVVIEGVVVSENPR